MSDAEPTENSSDAHELSELCGVSAECLFDLTTRYGHPTQQDAVVVFTNAANGNGSVIETVVCKGGEVSIKTAYPIGTHIGDDIRSAIDLLIKAAVSRARVQKPSIDRADMHRKFEPHTLGFLDAWDFRPQSVEELATAIRDIESAAQELNALIEPIRNQIDDLISQEGEV